jgi:hypothetical protein
MTIRSGMPVRDDDAPPVRRGPGLAGAALAAVLAGFVVRCANPVELTCENAVQRLVDCCPGFDASALECRIPMTLCGGEHTEIEGREARCIADASCDALVTHGTCSIVLDPSARFPYDGGWRTSPCP